MSRRLHHEKPQHPHGADDDQGHEGPERLDQDEGHGLGSPTGLDEELDDQLDAGSHHEDDE